MAGPAWTPENFMLMDPERPLENPNELLRLRRGQMADPHAMNHNCPCCHKTMAWPLFRAHARACYLSWRLIKNKGRVFAGGGPNG